jgi:predicted nucleic acid-binding protein
VKQILLDTNVLLSFVTDRDREQQLRADELFRSAAEGEQQLIVHQTVLSEMVYVLLGLYRVDPQEAAGILDDLLAMPGISTLDKLSWAGLLDLWPESVRDFGDAVLAAVFVQGRYDAIATFDEKFRRRLKALKISAYW